MNDDEIKTVIANAVRDALRSLVARVEKLEAAKVPSAPETPLRAPHDDFGRGSTNALIDRAVGQMNPGRMMARGDMKGSPGDGRDWNLGGKR